MLRRDLRCLVSAVATPPRLIRESPTKASIDRTDWWRSRSWAQASSAWQETDLVVDCGSGGGGRLLRKRVLGWAAAAIGLLALVAAPPALGLDLPVSLISFLWIVTLSVILGIAGSRSATAAA